MVGIGWHVNLLSRHSYITLLICCPDDTASNSYEYKLCISPYILILKVVKVWAMLG
jgi:hypothetical protein